MRAVVLGDWLSVSHYFDITEGAFQASRPLRVAQEMLVTSYLTVGELCRAHVCVWLTDGPFWGSLAD
jgi:hypothetical protein